MVKVIEINIGFISEKTNEYPAFKPDGLRFKTSEKTIKLKTDHSYKIVIKTQPVIDFNFLDIDGIRIVLHPVQPAGSGEYTCTWNTTGIPITNNNNRKDLILILSGSGGSIERTLQTKFYAENDSHGSSGEKLETMIWRCSLDTYGTITVSEEIFKNKRLNVIQTK
uniref:CB1 cannabinoid receptor-interacting protein 1 n=1 Tax=Parastrongyloides trichosuri TaxID=131310 RepID=A0A0N4ZRD5_PARTI